MSVSTLAPLLLAAVCATENPGPGREWLEGDYRAIPVSVDHQDAAFDRLGNSLFEPLDFETARALAGDKTLPETLRYYLARTAYRGDGPRGTFPKDVLVGLDVDTTGLGVVVSHRFSDTADEVQITAVLASQVEIKKLMTQCMWATH